MKTTYTASVSRRIVLTSILLTTGFVAGCSKKTTEAPVVRPVRSVIVTSSSGSNVTTYTGEIRSRYETDLSFQVGGKIASRAVDVGAAVKKGAVLAQIDRTDQQVSVDAARAAVNAARAELA